MPAEQFTENYPFRPSVRQETEVSPPTQPGWSIEPRRHEDGGGASMTLRFQVKYEVIPLEIFTEPLPSVDESDLIDPEEFAAQAQRNRQYLQTLSADWVDIDLPDDNPFLS